MNLIPGQTFGAYQIIEQIGRGGMASVYKANEPSLDRRVALKVLPPEFLHDETFAARFQREAKVVAKLEHPNIIPIFSFGIEGGTPWMAMRLISGGNLSAVLKKGPFGLQKSVAVIRAVADALTYAHAQGVVHRDVKPQNILLDQEGRVYLADFGIARMIEGGAAITRTGLVSGTPQYMAPEQATGQTLDHRMDIYALGIVAYEMFTGSTPFSADTPVAVLMKQVSAPIPIPPKEEVPEALLGPLLKSLAKNPEERWKTAADLAAAFEKGLSSVRTAVGGAGVESLPPTAVLDRTQNLPPRPPAPPLGGRSARVPPTLPPRSGASAPPLRRGTNALALWLGLAFVGLMAVGASVAFWLWQRSATISDPQPVISLAPSPAATLVPPAPTPMATAAPEVTLTTTPSPTAVSVAPSHGPSVSPVAPVKPEPRDTPVHAPTTTIPVAIAPVTTTLVAEPQSVPTTTTLPRPVAPALPAGHPFQVGERIAVGGQQVGPVTLLGVTFKSARPDELDVQIEFFCAKGKDQMVTYELVLLDGTGAPLLTVKGKKGVEEKDHGTAKQKERGAPGFFESAKSFRVTFMSVPD